MRTKLFGIMLLVGSATISPLAAQVEPAAESSGFHLNMAATYNPARFIVLHGTGFWLQGGNVQVETKLGERAGLVADARGFHTAKINSSSAGLDMITTTVGPRYTRQLGRFSVFIDALAGKTMAFNGLFPHGSGYTTSASGFALIGGGGVNMMLSRRLALRPFEANWMYTHLPNGATNVQSALLLGVGITCWFR